MMDKRKIIKELEKRKEQLKKKNVRKIGLFGSYLKGTQVRGSDIDFLITFNKIDSNDYFDVWFYLRNIFQRKIDLVIDKSLRKEFDYVKQEAEYVIL